MADACMPEKFYELARPMLPPEKEIGPEGGRPPNESSYRAESDLVRAGDGLPLERCAARRWAAVAKPRAPDCKPGNAPAFGSNCINCC